MKRWHDQCNITRHYTKGTSFIFEKGAASGSVRCNILNPQSVGDLIVTTRQGPTKVLRED